ncbi:MAG TPA: DUF4328 domain-containing protein, partial [Pyrinomonadaceae bacterium]
GPAGLTASEPFESAHTRATVVVVLFALYVVVALAAVAANVAQLALPPVVLAAAEEGGEQLTLGDLFQFIIALATLCVFVALVVAFCLWLHRAAKNLRALGNKNMEHSPGWAVGSFFVPFVNLVVPYKAVKEVWLKSDPSAHIEEGVMFTAPSSTPPLVLGWWIAWLVSNFLGRLSWRLQDNSTLGTHDFVVGVDIISDLANVVAAVLAVLVVRGIDRRQAERARHVTYIPHTPPPPPLFRPGMPS